MQDDDQQGDDGDEDGGAHLDKVPEFGIKHQCRFKFFMQTCQIMMFSRVLCAS